MSNEKKKRNLQKPQAGKQKKAKNITIEDTPLGTITEKNSAFNQVKRELFEAAKNGDFSYKGYVYGSILDRLKGKGFKVLEIEEGDFSHVIKSEISWENAFTNINEIDLDNYPIDECSLSQLLYITSYRALRKIKSTQNNKSEEKTKDIKLKKDGTILIVEDRIEEKIGGFSDDVLKKQGYDIQFAENLEKARELLNELLRKNKIDGIILDFSIDTNKDDKSPTTDGVPNGIVLLREFLFKLNTARIPIVINTTGDEEYKNKYLGTMNLEMPIYNVNHQATPLASPNLNFQVIHEILNMFDSRNETRNIIPDKKWDGKGETGYLDNKGHYHYRRDGD